VRKLLDGDRLGRLVMFESHYDRYRQRPGCTRGGRTARPGGGVLFDLGAHLVDQALVLFGVPQSVWASVRVEREGPGSMTPSTCVCTIPRLGQVSSSASGPRPRV
jgi:scyllo-inositol 2-dehydrogenase (NADP+)